jgi:hypothetical protein
MYCYVIKSPIDGKNVNLAHMPSKAPKKIELYFCTRFTPLILHTIFATNNIICIGVRLFAAKERIGTNCG